MSILATGLTAIGKLIVLGVLLAAFMAGMAGVVYMSLTGDEVRVPEIVGKDFVESEKELAALGLKIKRRADRTSSEKINTVLEQLPRAGETVKTGQLILVVVSKAGEPGDEAPKSLIQDIESDDTEKIEEMISDKPKKSRAPTNSNTDRKKADTTRDVIANTTATPNTASNSSTPTDGGARTDTPPAGEPKKEVEASPTPRAKPSPAQPRTGSGETRPRTTPQP
ncbi:MAG TPA: PASTA domain-containing protein [Pyrinomonadaceae bacterium]|nr:PASTA domain-containing protein [Pyrinomonadaceae bacterium]